MSSPMYAERALVPLRLIGESIQYFQTPSDALADIDRLRRPDAGACLVGISEDALKRAGLGTRVLQPQLHPHAANFGIPSMTTMRVTFATDLWMGVDFFIFAAGNMVVTLAIMSVSGEPSLTLEKQTVDAAYARAASAAAAVSLA